MRLASVNKSIPCVFHHAFAGVHSSVSPTIRFPVGFNAFFSAFLFLSFMLSSFFPYASFLVIRPGTLNRASPLPAVIQNLTLTVNLLLTEKCGLNTCTQYARS